MRLLSLQNLCEPQLSHWNRYKTPDNFYRTNWNINFVPTLARYERVDGEVKETGRLVEGELLDKKRIYDLIKN